MSKLYVSMGRAGDLLSQLPLFHKESQSTGQKVKVMVAREFASVLDGCSYIEPVIYDGWFLELEKAYEIAKGMSNDVVVLSVHGLEFVNPDGSIRNTVRDVTYKAQGHTGRMTTSFQLEPWKLAGRLNDFYEDYPLIFDRRNPEREDRLLRANGFKAKGKRKPVILLALGGVNCPFPHADLLRELVTAKFSADYRIIDLPMVEQPDGRIYDLLAIYENAALLITSDSMPLHLAWACRSLPVFALANDRDPKGNPSLWHGSVWRPNHLWFCRYSDWPARAVEMCLAIGSVNFDHDRDPDHVYVGTLKDCDDYGEPFLAWMQLSIKKGMCSREADGHPFVRDVIRMGMQRCVSDEKVLILMRDGVEENDELAGRPYFSYRTHKGQHVPIVDLFSAPKEFWKKIMPEIPDLILDDGAEWAQALMVLFKKYGATDATGCCEFVGGEK